MAMGQCGNVVMWQCGNGAQKGASQKACKYIKIICFCNRSTDQAHELNSLAMRFLYEFIYVLDDFG